MQSSATLSFSLLLILCLAIGHAAPASDGAEEEMKAAVVLGFVRYSEWPAAAVGKGYLVVGFSGPPSVAATMKRLLDGKSATGRQIRVVEWSPEADPQSYQLVYFAAGTEASNKQFSKLTSQGTALLTVGDATDFLDAGGAIRLMLVDGRMSFEFRIDVLERSGVSISSKLLRFGQMRRGRKM